MRNNPSYISRVFAGSNGEADETERPRSSSRNEDKWRGTVFEGPI